MLESGALAVLLTLHSPLFFWLSSCPSTLYVVMTCGAEARATRCIAGQCDAWIHEIRGKAKAAAATQFLRCVGKATHAGRVLLKRREAHHVKLADGFDPPVPVWTVVHTHCTRGERSRGVMMCQEG